MSIDAPEAPEPTLHSDVPFKAEVTHLMSFAYKLRHALPEDLDRAHKEMQRQLYAALEGAKNGQP